jgi:hypothetical protein
MSGPVNAGKKGCFRRGRFLSSAVFQIALNMSLSMSIDLG